MIFVVVVDEGQREKFKIRMMEQERKKEREKEQKLCTNAKYTTHTGRKKPRYEEIE